MRPHPQGARPAGRRHIIGLADGGRALLAGCAPAVGELEETMPGGFTAAERAAFRDHLDRCRAALSRTPSR